MVNTDIERVIIIYFENEDHKSNYDYLMKYYNLVHLQKKYLEACIYVAASPEIFKCINLTALEGHTPLHWYFDIQNAPAKGHKPYLLTGTSQTLLEAGLAIYSGMDICLKGTLVQLNGTDLGKVFTQACDLILKNSA